MLIGGTDFLANKKRGAGFFDNVSSAIHTQRNRHNVRQATATSDTAAKPTKAQAIGNAAKGALRLATLPVGVMKDLLQGGAITAGKNFIPRVRNVIAGTTFVNRADFVKKAEDKATENVKDDKTDAEHETKETDKAKEDKAE